jgi:hypothetical protein
VRPRLILTVFCSLSSQFAKEVLLAVVGMEASDSGDGW